MVRVAFPYKIALMLALVYIVSMNIGLPAWRVLAFVVFTSIALFCYFTAIMAWLVDPFSDGTLPPTFIALIFTALDVALFI